MSEFVHQGYRDGETIAAIATPAGDGGVAIVRISGREAVAVAGRCFSRGVEGLESHKMVYGAVMDGEEVVDRVLLVVMRAPRSFTGEDVVEIHCHGGSLVTRRALEVVLRCGARAALPGEFSFQAFMNGKMDLAQAEAVQELIGARSERALEAAKGQLEGGLSERVRGFQWELAGVAAILEAWVDFPEEGLEFASVEEVIERLEGVLGRVVGLGKTFDEGRLLHAGVQLCLAGPPNVGKSSLMNALLLKERAIVTPIAGTTRDVLEEEMRLGGLHFRVMDTAGIHASDEVIELEGIRRSKVAMERADLVLLVLDAGLGVDAEAKELLEVAPKGKTLLVWNKVDLEHGELLKPSMRVSARTGEGLDELKSALVEWALGQQNLSKEAVVITQSRHKAALVEAVEHLKAVVQGLRDDVSAEFVAFDMRAALSSLGLIIGTNVTEDVLFSIFSTFCIGK